MRCLQRRLIREVQEHENDQQHDWENDLQPGAGPFLVLPLSAPVDVVARGQDDVTCHGRPGFPDEASHVATLDIEKHSGEQQAVFGGNHRWTTCVINPRDL